MRHHPPTDGPVTSGMCMLFLAFFIARPGIAPAQNWSVIFQGVGTFSSPRVTDLNGDGIGDIILGAGREEFHACDSSVVALDGRDGRLLWRVRAVDQIFGSAALKDLNGDGVMDIVI